MPAHLLDWPVQKNNLKDLGGGGSLFHDRLSKLQTVGGISGEGGGKNKR